jgi:mannosyl-oligosaccharide alpha-1,2-mannosidase
MTTSTGVLPSYQRFANGVPVPLFSRRSFRPREKYLILLVFLTFGIVCFGAFFFLPDFRTGGAAVNSVYRVYQHMQKAGPDLLLPVPPRASSEIKGSRSAGGHPNAVPPGHEGSDHQDVHLVEDKQKLQVRNARSLESLSFIFSNASPKTRHSSARNRFVLRASNLCRVILRRI